MPEMLATARHVRSADGVELAAYDFGGTGPDLLLAHATGFHARAFLPLVSYLVGAFHCYGFDERGHGASTAPTNGDFHWQRFAKDALAVADAFDLRRPAAFGHSCGGALLVLAELEQPGRWEQLYLYEPVLMPRTNAPEGLAGQNPLAVGALRRRREFPDRRAAESNFASKPPLDVLRPDALRAYVEFGFDDTAQGTVRLACSPESEAATYHMALRHDAWEHLADVHCPTTVAGGDTTAHIGPEATRSIAARLGRGRAEVLPGLGHFGPLERPDAVARSMLAALVSPA
jgi:pimeloyl-ACP methyl ester carboxylesterase